jgi:hypothetical protein
MARKPAVRHHWMMYKEWELRAGEKVRFARRDDLEIAVV